MVKQVMGQPLVLEAFHHAAALRTRPSYNLKRCTHCQLHKKVPLLPPPTSSEVKTAVQPHFPKHSLTPVTLTITGTVTIKTSITPEEGVMAIMLQQFDSTATRRGIVMQLVSTEIDPSKNSSLICDHLINVFSL